jgi:cellulose synthase/poly-beta-1,6-N-acetylglucosamine synthase-like glycosyltransferase
VICTHRSDRYEDFAEAISSLKTQTYENLEIVVVVDGNKGLYSRILKIGIDAFRGEMGVKRKKAHKVVNLVRK